MGNTIGDTSFCDGTTNIYDKMTLKIFINTIAKPHLKKLTNTIVLYFKVKIGKVATTLLPVYGRLYLCR